MLLALPYYFSRRQMAADASQAVSLLFATCASLQPYWLEAQVLHFFDEGQTVDICVLFSRLFAGRGVSLPCNAINHWPRVIYGVELPRKNKGHTKEEGQQINFELASKLSKIKWKDWPRWKIASLLRWKEKEWERRESEYWEKVLWSGVLEVASVGWCLLVLLVAAAARWWFVVR